MSFSEQMEQYRSHLWEKRRETLGEMVEQAEQLLRQGTAEEAKYLRFVFATMPLSDFADYDLSLFLHTVRHALRVRKEFHWCAALPEHLFLTGVLYPRINTEELSDCRGFFYEKLADRVRNLSLRDAILEVNRWCAEEVTYRSTDDRTASALSVYRCGYGRCGEESTFAVNALRSVGICARQVYVPWWSHCDDNHAWVEVFDGENWRYLGACEPEPELDRGWFTAAAARAMMIRSRTFASGNKEDFSFLFPDTEPANLWTEQGVVYEAVTSRYAETAEIEVTVVEKSGRPAAGVDVTFSLLNMAYFSAIAVLKTDQGGKVKLRLGLGSVKVSAAYGKDRAETLFHVGETQKVTLMLQEMADQKTDWTDFDFVSPAGADGYPAPLSPEQQKRRREWLDAAGKLRAQKAARLQAEEKQILSEQEKRIFETLTEKDQAVELPRDVLLDSLPAFRWERDFPPELFSSALLCPRIGLEPLRPWRENFSAAFSPEEQEKFREDPASIWDWIKKNVREREDYPALPASPGAVLRTGASSQTGKAVLFCALCRSMGIPARLSPADGSPEYYRDGDFYAADGKTERGTLLLSAPAGQEASFFQNLSLTRLEAGREIPISGEKIPAGESLTFSLPPGTYRVLTANRLPNGNQLARQLEFSLCAGEIRQIDLNFRQGKNTDFLTARALPPFSLQDREGREILSAKLLERHPISLLFWLEVGREPTEHILNELREAAVSFSQWNCGLHFILVSAEQEQDPTLQKALALLPNHHLWQGDFRDTVSMLARRMFVEPDKLPLILLADRQGNGLYGCAGYNVGTGSLLLRLLEELRNI
ncbi:MAG: hypothetical protein J1E06_04350 [Acutalibacter sp.]|nr:hypothetical protein [Acutalibacter sp.]